MAGKSEVGMQVDDRGATRLVRAGGVTQQCTGCVPGSARVGGRCVVVGVQVDDHCATHLAHWHDLMTHQWWSWFSQGRGQMCGGREWG